MPIHYNIQKIEEQIAHTAGQESEFEMQKLQNLERLEMMKNEKQQVQQDKLEIVMEIEDTQQMLDQTMAKDQQIGYVYHLLRQTNDMDAVYDRIVS